LSLPASLPPVSVPLPASSPPPTSVLDELHAPTANATFATRPPPATTSAILRKAKPLRMRRTIASSPETAASKLNRARSIEIDLVETSDEGGDDVRCIGAPRGGGRRRSRLSLL